jgi:ATP-dependent Lon protease
VTGLAWTQVGGELLTIETSSVLGKGKLQYTGSLGDVMKESIHAAMTVVRSRHKKLRINEDFYEKRDIHVHVPEGATPKDGPSAGIAMCSVIASILSGKKIRSEIAMTGEVSLSGDVLPIGGLKEKLIAAHKAGMTKVLIPAKNYERDLEDIPQEVQDAMEIVGVTRIEEVLKQILV